MKNCFQKGKHSFKLLIGIAIFLLPSLAWSGDPGPLCDTVKKATNIVEVEVTIQDPIPTDYLQKKWHLEPKHLKKTAQTAKIVSVLKGAPDLEGKTLTSVLFPEKKPVAYQSQLAEYIYPYSLNNHKGAWLAFFQAKQVRIFISIEGPKKPEWTLQDWYGLGGCNVNICKDYQEGKKEVLSCVKEQAKKP